MSGNPPIGTLTCPHCGNQAASVHRMKKGSRLMYYKCYGGPQGDCGTVQLYGAHGQQWIRDHLEHADPPADPLPESEPRESSGPPADEIADLGNGATPAPTPTDPEPAERSSLWNRIFSE